MATSLAKMRMQARRAGINAQLIRRASTVEELQQVMDDHAAHENGATAKPRKKTRGQLRTAKTQRAKKTTGRTSVPAKKSAQTGTAKRRSTATPAKTTTEKPKRKSSYVPKGGRNLLGKLDFNKTEGWNPREGSAPDRIIKALKRFRGNRQKAYDYLLEDVDDFVGKIKRSGDKRTAQEKRDMLKYRIARTAWQFALATGQHKEATNRVEYGKGGTGNGTWKPAKPVKKQPVKAKSSAKKQTRKPQAPKQTRTRREQAATRNKTETRRTTARTPRKSGRQTSRQK
jgi:hypothetical protein